MWIEIRQEILIVTQIRFQGMFQAVQGESKESACSECRLLRRQSLEGSSCEFAVSSLEFAVEGLDSGQVSVFRLLAPAPCIWGAPLRVVATGVER